MKKYLVLPINNKANNKANSIYLSIGNLSLTNNTITGNEVEIINKNGLITSVINITVLDGKTVFGEKDREICTVEGIHPNDLGFYRIAQAVYKLYGKIDKNFLVKHTITSVKR